jgi:hypothetical protein
MENVFAAFKPTRKRTTPISLLDDCSLEILTVTVVSAKFVSVVYVQHLKFGN